MRWSSPPGQLVSNIIHGSSWRRVRQININSCCAVQGCGRPFKYGSQLIYGNYTDHLFSSSSRRWFGSASWNTGNSVCPCYGWSLLVNHRKFYLAMDHFKDTWAEPEELQQFFYCRSTCPKSVSSSSNPRHVYLTRLDATCHLLSFVIGTATGLLWLCWAPQYLLSIVQQRSKSYKFPCRI